MIINRCELKPTCVVFSLTTTSTSTTTNIFFQSMTLYFHYLKRRQQINTCTCVSLSVQSFYVPYGLEHWQSSTYWCCCRPWWATTRSISAIYTNYKNKNWLQFFFIVKTFVLKQQISKFYPHIQRAEASDHIYFSQRPVINVKAIFCA